MAGHSKWANIRHRKGRQDAKRGKIFTKLIREITVAARAGGNPEDNPRLRAAIDKALGSNMSRDTIDRAVARGAGDNQADQLDELTYEGYGPGGTAVLVEAMTDNKNRTVSEVRHAFSKSGGTLGTNGSVAYLFNRLGVIRLAADGTDESELFEVALNAGAEDIKLEGDFFVVQTPFGREFGAVQDAIKAAGLTITDSEVAMLPENYVEMTDMTEAQKILRLIDVLEELDDVQEVYSNAEFSADVLAQLEEQD